MKLELSAVSPDEILCNDVRSPLKIGDRKVAVSLLYSSTPLNLSSTTYSIETPFGVMRTTEDLSITGLNKLSEFYITPPKIDIVHIQQGQIISLDILEVPEASNLVGAVGFLYSERVKAWQMVKIFYLGVPNFITFEPLLSFVSLTHQQLLGLEPHESIPVKTVNIRLA